MRRSEHRILTTHVGSLIRPKPLLEAAHDSARRDNYETVLARAVADVVAQQAATGYGEPAVVGTLTPADAAYTHSLLRGATPRSNPALHGRAGLLRFAHNDGSGNRQPLKSLSRRRTSCNRRA
jgi:hypothetical protein